jgi:hypothetical protein
MIDDFRLTQAASLDRAAQQQRRLGQRLLAQCLENAERYEQQARILRERHE